jgi:hypothetical protein
MAAIAVAGSIAQRPGHGGHVWVFLNYLLGLRSLGHEVTFVDRLDAGMLAGNPAPEAIADSAEARWLHAVMREAGLAGDYILISDEGEARQTALDLLAEVDLLINVNGFLRDEELLDAAEVAAFLDVDPGIQQMWEALGQASIFAGHDLHFTVGENIGRGGCAIPTGDIEWQSTRQPVQIDRWPIEPGGEGFTTVATWRGPYAPIEFAGRTFGLRVHEFRRFMELPQRVAADFRLALDIDRSDSRDLAALRGAGWQLLDPAEVAATPVEYHRFIQRSAAELAIPKQVYVETRSGWFSDRSACYLAAGKPVLTVDTGFSDFLPTGAGLLCFDDVEAAAQACEEVAGNPAVHQRAAREIALEYFDSARVLTRLLDAAGVAERGRPAW